MCKSPNSGNLVKEKKKSQVKKKKKHVTRSDENIKKSLYSEAHLHKIFALKHNHNTAKGNAEDERERERENCEIKQIHRHSIHIEPTLSIITKHN